MQTQTLHGKVDSDVLSCRQTGTVDSDVLLHMSTNSSISEVLLAFASNDKYNSLIHQSPLPLPPSQLLPPSFTLSDAYHRPITKRHKSMSQFPERHNGDSISDSMLCCRILRRSTERHLPISHSYCRLARYTRFLVLRPIEVAGMIKQYHVNMCRK